MIQYINNTEKMNSLNELSEMVTSEEVLGHLRAEGVKYFFSKVLPINLVSHKCIKPIINSLVNSFPARVCLSFSVFLPDLSCYCHVCREEAAQNGELL